MSALDIILSRRSIRKYQVQQVSDEIIEKLLQAGMSAPSACNQQPWRFVVIRDRDSLDGLSKIHPYAKMLKSAPLAIMVCGDERSLEAPNYWPQDCSAAAQNILLAAHALGLGGVWLGMYPARASSLRKKFDLPDGVSPFCLLSIGYPAEHKPPANRYNGSHVHFERWQEQES